MSIPPLFAGPSDFPPRLRKGGKSPGLLARRTGKSSFDWCRLPSVHGVAHLDLKVAGGWENDVSTLQVVKHMPVGGRRNHTYEDVTLPEVPLLSLRSLLGLSNLGASQVRPSG